MLTRTVSLTFRFDCFSSVSYRFGPMEKFNWVDDEDNDVMMMSGKGFFDALCPYGHALCDRIILRDGVMRLYVVNHGL